MVDDKQSKKDKKGEDAVREVPNLHKEQLLSILETICTQMGQVVVRCALSSGFCERSMDRKVR